MAPTVYEDENGLTIEWPGGERPEAFEITAEAFEALVGIANSRRPPTESEAYGAELVSTGWRWEPHIITHLASIVWLAALTIGALV